MFTQKIIIKILWSSILLVSMVFANVAAIYSQKLGYVSATAIIENYPEAKSAKTKLAEFQSNWLNDIAEQEKNIKLQKDSLHNNRLLWSNQEKKDCETRIAEMQSKLNSFRYAKFGLDGEFEKKQAEIFTPVYDKIAKAIEDEAKAQKMDFIFDKSNRTLPMLYSNPNNDISVLVLKRLGVDITKDSLNAQAKANENSAMSNRGKPREGSNTQVPNFDPNDILNKVKPDMPALPKDVVKPPNQ